MCPALAKLKMHIMGNTLLPYEKYPFEIKGACVFIRFAAHHYKLDIIQIR